MLKGETGPPDVLKHQIDVFESISGVTLKNGNRATLLIDDPTTYAPMFKVIHDAQDHIDLETVIVADDDERQRICDPLLLKKASDVQDGIMCDSVGSIHRAAVHRGGEGITQFVKLQADGDIIMPMYSRKLIFYFRGHR